MTDNASPAEPPAAGRTPASGSASVGSPQGRFEFLPAGGREPATVRCAGDIDLINVGQFQAALDQAAAASGDVTADMTAVTYCDSAAIRALFSTARRGRLTIQVRAAGPINETMLKVSGLDQIATVVTLD
ncbi:MAG: STAS domain-containing protein [Trebonia sp.]|jgi:anti-anti-sigma factor